MRVRPAGVLVLDRVRIESAILPMLPAGCRITLASMNQHLPIYRVEVTFVGSAPARQVERASGVSEVEVRGQLLRCLVRGSVQPFLEALHGYEVLTLNSSPALCGGPS